jgi:hypothetical protein
MKQLSNNFKLLISAVLVLFMSGNAAYSGDVWFVTPPFTSACSSLVEELPVENECKKRFCQQLSNSFESLPFLQMVRGCFPEGTEGIVGACIETADSVREKLSDLDLLWVPILHEHKNVVNIYLNRFEDDYEGLCRRF